MRVLHLSTSDIHGGAALAAHRIHHALLDGGVESRMSVRAKLGDEWHVRSDPHKIGRVAATLGGLIKGKLNEVVLRPSAPFSTQFLPGDGSVGIKNIDTNVVHLHWICDGFLGIRAIGRLSRPIVWTIHDQWPFTGGCHYSGNCERYTHSCGNCPVLRGNSESDVSRCVHRAKRRFWKGLDIAVVSPSRWMAECAQRSSLFRDRDVKVIPNPIDLEVFKPIPKDRARFLLEIDPKRPTILFTAMSATTDRRKGFDLLESALELMTANHRGFQAVVVGASDPTPPDNNAKNLRFLGHLHDDADMVLAYSAADVLVVPSREDNFPNTVIESLACGTPVAAFRVGGIPEMITHRRTGFLAQPFDTEHLLKGILFLLEDENRLTLAAEARASAERLFDQQAIAAEYLDLYYSISNESEFDRAD